MMWDTLYMSGINIKNATKINIGNSSIFNPENLRNSVVFLCTMKKLWQIKLSIIEKGGKRTSKSLF